MNVRKNPLEWSVFAVALAIVAGCVAVLVSAIVRTGDAPPDLVVSMGTPQRVSSGFLVPVHVKNAGDETATQVLVALALEAGEQELERAEVTIAFVPRRSVREAMVVFQHDPACCRIVVRSLGFEAP